MMLHGWLTAWLAYCVNPLLPGYDNREAVGSSSRLTVNQLLHDYNNREAVIMLHKTVSWFAYFLTVSLLHNREAVGSRNRLTVNQLLHG